MNISFSVIGGRLFQWDSGRKVAVIADGSIRIDQVHFAKAGDAQALVMEPRIADGLMTAEIPNVLLKEPGMLFVYAMAVDADGRMTRREAIFTVTGRAMPADYVYTETQIKDYAVLEKRVEALEKSGGSGINIPEWAMQPEKPVYTAEEVGALSMESLTGAIGTALAQAKESGEFDGKDGKTGKDGHTPEKGVDYWTEDDRAAMVQDVLAELTVWEGGSY